QQVKDERPRKRISSRLETLRTEVGKLEQEKEELAAPLTRIHLLQPFTDSGHARALREKEVGYVTTKIELRRLDNRKQEVVDRLKDHDRLEIKETEKNYQDSLAKLNSLAGDIADHEVQRDG